MTTAVAPGQLELFTPVQDRPYTGLVTVPFTWERVDYLLNLPSVDFYEEGLSLEENRDEKRWDDGYEDLLADIATNGMIDPVFVYEDETEECLGNGHHRVVACLDLGYTYVPVTRNPRLQWSEQGFTTCS